MAWTKEEIVAFKEKDMRISKLAIIKSLIEKLSEEDVCEVQKVIKLTEEYVNYVYTERSTKGDAVGCVADPTKHKPNWEQLAIGLNLAIPNSQNIKILNQILDEYKTASKASANPKDVLNCCIEKFGTYPTKTESVSKVVKQLLRR